MKTNHTTIKWYERVDSITGGWEWCLFLTNKPDFYHFLVGECSISSHWTAPQQLTQQYTAMDTIRTRGGSA